MNESDELNVGRIEQLTSSEGPLKIRPEDMIRVARLHPEGDPSGVIIAQEWPMKAPWETVPEDYELVQSVVIFDPRRTSHPDQFKRVIKIQRQLKRQLTSEAKKKFLSVAVNMETPIPAVNFMLEPMITIETIKTYSFEEWDAGLSVPLGGS